MKIVIPVACASESEEFLAVRPFPGGCLAGKLARTACALPGAVVHVHVRDERLGAVLESQGLPVFFAGPVAAASGLEPNALLPLGGAAALADLMQAGLLRAEEPVVLADWRFPLLQGETLAKAWEFACGPGPEVGTSMQLVRDHPVQHNVPYRIVGVDMLVFPDAEASHGACGLSRPFPFDWKRYRLPPSGAEMFVMARGERSPQLFPHPVTGPGDAVPGALSRVLLRPDQEHARLVLPAPASARESCKALPASLSPSAVPVDLCQADGMVRCSVDATSLPLGAVLRLWPVRGSLAGEGCSFPLHGRQADASPLVFEVPSAVDADAVVVCVLADGGDECDFFEPAELGESLWDIEVKTMQRLCKLTAKPLCNRQDFPELLEPSGALAAGRVSALMGVRPCDAVARLDLGGPDMVKVSGEMEYHAVLADHGVAVQGSERCAGFLTQEGVASSAPCAPAGAPCKAQWNVRSVWDGVRLDLEALAADVAQFSIRPTPELEAEIRSAFDLVDASLEEALWRHGLLDTLSGRQTEARKHDLSLGTTIGQAMGNLYALRQASREVSLAFQRTLAAVKSWKQGAFRPAQRTVVGPLPTSPTRVLTSDGASRLYLSAYEADLDGGLFIKDLRTGGLEPFAQGHAYSGLWFDAGQQLLYAAQYAEGKAVAPGLDIYDPQGALVERIPFVQEGGQQRYLPCCLHGDATRLFFIDILTSSIVCLRKKDMKELDVLHDANTPFVSDFLVCDGALYSSMRFQHLLGRSPLGGGEQFYATGIDLVFPYALDIHDSTKTVYVVTCEHEPLAQERQEHWLKRVDMDFRTTGTFSLGQKRVQNIHIMQGTGVLALLDYHDGLELYELGG